jgi:hypothetical protein
MDDPDDWLQLPPGEACLECECGFQSRPFCFDEQLYGCLRCSSVVSAERVPFLYHPPKCPSCDTQFLTTDRILAGNMCSGDATRCPVCQKLTLTLKQYGLHLQSSDCGDCIPDVGQLIHAKTMPTDRQEIELFFWSPRLKMDYALAVSIVNRDPKMIPWSHHEFRVESIAHSPPRLRLQYIRELEQSEWQWFTHL